MAELNLNGFTCLFEKRANPPNQSSLSAQSNHSDQFPYNPLNLLSNPPQRDHPILLLSTDFNQLYREEQPGVQQQEQLEEQRLENQQQQPKELQPPPEEPLQQLKEQQQQPRELQQPKELQQQEEQQENLVPL
jgi:hypothetical protein